MRRIARLTVLGVMAALLAAVPIAEAQAPPVLNVEPEIATVKIETGAKVTYTVTVTPASAQEVRYYTTDFLTTSPACTTDATTGSCTFTYNYGGSVPGENDTDVLHFYIEVDPDPIPPLANEADRDEPTDETMDTPAEPAGGNDNTDVVEAHWENPAAKTLNLDPETPTASPGQEVTINAEVKDQFGARMPNANVDAEIETGPNKNRVMTGVDLECKTGTNGAPCQLKYTPKTGEGEAGTDKIRGWIDTDNDQAVDDASDNIDKTESLTDEPAAQGPDNTDVVEVKIESAQGVDLDVEPETQTVTLDSVQATARTSADGAAAAAQAADASVTATVDESGVDAANKKVIFTVTGGPNAGTTFECTTDSAGSCTGTYSGTAAGTDQVRGVVDTDGNGQPNEADATEGPAESAEGGAKAEVDETDVVEVVWSEDEPPPPSCTGTQEDDLLIGTDGDDTCRSFGGNDTIQGKGGDDDANGGGGHDKLNLGPGNDSGHGGPGTDLVRGGPGRDELNGGGGKNDRTPGGPGRDSCRSENAPGCE